MIQRCLQFFHQPCLPLLRVEFFTLLQPVHLVLLAVHFREFEQMFFLSSLRNGVLCPFDVPFDVDGYDDFLRRATESFSDFRYGECEKFAVCFLQFSFVFDGESLVDASVCDVQVVDESVVVVVVVGDAEDVDVVDGVADDFAFGAVVFNADDLLLDVFSFLESQLFCL